MTTTGEPITVPARIDPNHPPQVEIVIPVYNEEGCIETSVRRLHRYLEQRFPLAWQITVADNASTDRTWGIACRLAGELDNVAATHLDQKGRGRALRTTWMASAAPVVAYMDVDLATDLDALLPLVAPLLSGHSDVAIGTRLATGARVVRGPRREAISRSYNLILKAALRSGFSDAQCGFKAIRTDVARVLLPEVEDQGWFFDTELLVLAEHNGLRIHEVPVDWVDDPDSRVDVVGTARADLAGVWRMLGRTLTGKASVRGARRPRDARGVPDLGSQLVRFASIGVVSTLVFAALFALLVGRIGPFLADIVALGVCTVANTAANRRLTFAVGGRSGWARHQGVGLAVAALPLTLTLGALAVLEVVGATALGVQLVVLTAVNLLASVGRFVVLRRWLAADDATPEDPGPTDRSSVDGTSLDSTSVSEASADASPTAELPVERRRRVAAFVRSDHHLMRRARQLVRYGTVSIIATSVSMTVLGLLVATQTVAAGWANVIATAVGTVPSFELNRRWVWKKQGQRSMRAEIIPFCVLSFLGLGLSTLSVSLVAAWADQAGLDATVRTVAVEAANVTAWGSLWIAQFLILDRLLFGRNRATAEPIIPLGEAIVGQYRDTDADTDTETAAGLRSSGSGSVADHRPRILTS